jgi:deoxyribodipyrimidine photo-lyase
MHNRVCMVVASFLVKHLLIDWRQGEQWFWDTLVDADAGSNSANWQWMAGCGADAAPSEPIIDHKAGRERALAAYKKTRSD